MSDNNQEPTPIHDSIVNPEEVTKDKVSFIRYAKKAVAGAIAGFAGSIVSTLPATLSDGVFTVAEFWTTATIAVGFAVVGFFSVYLPSNEGNNG